MVPFFLIFFLLQGCKSKEVTPSIVSENEKSKTQNYGPLEFITPGVDDANCYLKLKDKIIYEHHCAGTPDNVVYYSRGFYNYADDDMVTVTPPDILILNRYDSDGCNPGEYVFVVVYESGDYFVEVIGNCLGIIETSRDTKGMTIHFPSGPVGANSIASALTYVFDYKTKKLEVK